MPANVSALHHVTIGCAVGELPALLRFYTECIGLQDGHRPALRFPGHWLYSSGRAILHLNALLPEAHASFGLATVDHVSFHAHELHRTRQWLREQGIEFSEVPLAGTRLQQVFLRDPLGTKIELTFDLEQEAGPARP